MLDIQAIYNSIIQNLVNLNMEQPTTSKRANEEPIGPSKRQKTIDEYEGPANVIKHYVIDKGNWDLSTDKILTLFNKVRIACLDTEPNKNGKVEQHYHVLGEAKVTKRVMRDMSLNDIRGASIQGGLESKGFYLTSRPCQVQSQQHFNNIIAYLKRKNGTFFEDESVVYGPKVNPIWCMLEEAERPTTHSKEDMQEFRRKFPLIDAWRPYVAKLKMNPKKAKMIVDQLESMETQRKYEDVLSPITDEEKHLLLPNMPLLSHAFKMRNAIINHDQNSGVCMVLCGSALMCKSTINRILGHSFGEVAVWPGSQWIAKDMLKFDSAARRGISTIIVEEMQWIDIEHRVSLEKTINSIKEQLSGAGIDVRLAKTRSALTDDIKLKIDQLLISMNETPLVNYRVLSQMINSKPEYKRRFLIVNMDDPNYEDIVKCRTRKDNNWVGRELQMEVLAAKAIKNPTLMFELQQMYEEWIYRQNEVQALLDLVDNNPEFFNDDIQELTEEEVIMDDCKRVLGEITNKIQNDF